MAESGNDRADAGRLTVVVYDRKGRDAALVLDEYEKSLGQLPKLEVLGTNSVYLHFYSDYGFYQRSIKYLFDRSSQEPPLKIRYGILSFKSVSHDGGKLYYSASYDPLEPVPPGWRKRTKTILVQPKDGDLPDFRIVDDTIPQPAPAGPTELRGPGGEVVTVQNTTPPGQPHRPSTIFVDQKPYPAPIPTVHFYRQTLPKKDPPLEMESDIGPYVQNGDKIWFATTFYDGEGVSGVGAIGTFDIASRKYEMRYLPEIAPWSGSAILLDGYDLLIGLMRQPEGATIGEGLLRYNMDSGAVQTFAVPDVVNTLDRAGDAIYCGTSHGLYMLRRDQVTQLRFEPNATGQLVMIQREVPPAAPAQPTAQ